MACEHNSRMMAPSGGVGGCSDTTMQGSPVVLLHDNNFPTWKHAFSMAATAHGWMSYYTSPSFDDPRVLTQTMAAVDVAMDVETLRRQEKPGMPTNGMPLEDRKLNDDLRLAALRQLKFREIHGLFMAKFQAQARMYLLSFLSQPLQVAVQSIECPYRMYMYLQDRFESATMTAIDVLRVILTAFSHDDHDQIDQHRILSLHFDRMDRLMTRLKSSIQPVDWAAMSVLDYDRHVWDSLHALLLRHSFRDITMDDLPPRPPPLLCPNGSTSEVDRTMSHIYHVLGHPPVASPSHTPLNHDMSPSKPIPDENPTSSEPTEYANASTTNDPVVSHQQQVQHFHTDHILIKVEPAVYDVACWSDTTPPTSTRPLSSSEPSIPSMAKASEAIHRLPDSAVASHSSTCPAVQISSSTVSLPSAASNNEPSIEATRHDHDAAVHTLSQICDTVKPCDDVERTPLSLVVADQLTCQDEGMPDACAALSSNKPCVPRPSDSLYEPPPPDKSESPLPHQPKHRHHRKPPPHVVTDTWAIPKKPRPDKTPASPERTTSHTPRLPRRSSTSSLLTTNIPASPSSPSSPSCPPALSRRSSTSSLDTLRHSVSPTSDLSQPPLKRRRKEVSRWGPKTALLPSHERHVVPANHLPSVPPPSPASATTTTTTTALTVHPPLVMDLSSIVVDSATVARSLYLSHLPTSPRVTEATLARLCRPFGVQIDSATLYPRIDVLMCPRTKRPRGDAVVYLTCPDNVPRAVAALLHGLQSLDQPANNNNSPVAVRAMDDRTYRLLYAQVYDPSKPPWTSHTRRVFPVNYTLSSSDWVCTVYVLHLRTPQL